MCTRIGWSVTLIWHCTCSSAETAAAAFASPCSIIHKTGIGRPNEFESIDTSAIFLFSTRTLSRSCVAVPQAQGDWYSRSTGKEAKPSKGFYKNVKLRQFAREKLLKGHFAVFFDGTSCYIHPLLQRKGCQMKAGSIQRRKNWRHRKASRNPPPS